MQKFIREECGISSIAFNKALDKVFDRESRKGRTMSTKHTVIKSANPNFPDDTLAFESGCSGTKFVFRVGSDQIKFWFDKEGWETLRDSVDGYIELIEIRKG